MAALCESFTLCGLGPSGGGVGLGGGLLALEPGPDPDHVLLTDRGRTATLFKVTPGPAPAARPREATLLPPGSPGLWGVPGRGLGTALPPAPARPSPGSSRGHPPPPDWLRGLRDGALPGSPALCRRSGGRLRRLLAYFCFC